MSSGNNGGGGMPPYYGKAMPANPKKIMDDNIEETTRRVGGRAGAAMVAPSLGAMPMPYNLSSQSKVIPGFGGASISTAPLKAPLTKQSVVNTPKYIWQLEAVPDLPEFHPLERTTVFVPQTSPAVIAERISDVMRERSIEAAYDNEKAKVKCFTSEGVDFRIRLYRGRSEYSHGIIVEVQRRFGSSLHFHSDTQAILDAAEGKTPMPPPPFIGSLPEVSDDEDDDEEEVFGSSSLVMVTKMLNLSGFDSQYLGLQTLLPLVDSERMSLQTARAVATSLLQRDSEVGTKVFQYVLNRTEDESAMILRLMALSILACAMRASSVVPEFLRSQLRPVFLQDLKDAEKHPNIALQSAKCIEYFVRGDHDTMELNEVFEVALKVGESRHVDLMNQTERCIAAIR